MAGGFAIFTSYPAFYSLLSRKKDKKTCKELELSRNRSVRFSVFLIQGFI